MGFNSPSQTYLKMIEYASHKRSQRFDQIFLQAMLAGFWIAIYGHSILKYGGAFYKANDSAAIGISNSIFGFLFPGAFMALVFTGSELFTGNTVTMILLLCHEGQKELGSLWKVWTLSFFGNYISCTICAYAFSILSGDFDVDSGAKQYLFYLMEKKIGHSFLNCFVLAIGCNSLVCLATWCSVCATDGASKILGMFYCVGVFVVGGYEHIIANMYLLTTALLAGYPTTYWTVIWKNWIPTFLGNLLAGTVLTGVLWWYAFHPKYTDLAPYTDKELVKELSQRQSFYKNKSDDGAAAKDSQDEKNLSGKTPSKWRNSGNFTKSRKSIFKPPHQSPVANRDLTDTMPDP